MNSMLAQVSVTTSTSGNAGTMWPVFTVLWLVVTVALIAATWKMFTKAGQPGWASLIPIYNTITLLRMTGRSGWLFLGMFVPFWNIFIAIRMVFELARVFGRGLGFGFGLLFLAPIFVMILGFGDSQYVNRNRSRIAPAPAGGFAAAPIGR